MEIIVCEIPRRRRYTSRQMDLNAWRVLLLDGIAVHSKMHACIQNLFNLLRWLARLLSDRKDHNKYTKIVYSYDPFYHLEDGPAIVEDWINFGYEHAF